MVSNKEGRNFWKVYLKSKWGPAEGLEAPFLEAFGSGPV